MYIYLYMYVRICIYCGVFGCMSVLYMSLWVNICLYVCLCMYVIVFIYLCNSTNSTLEYITDMLGRKGKGLKFWCSWGRTSPSVSLSPGRAEFCSYLRSWCSPWRRVSWRVRPGWPGRVWVQGRAPRSHSCLCRSRWRLRRSWCRVDDSPGCSSSLDLALPSSAAAPHDHRDV